MKNRGGIRRLTDASTLPLPPGHPRLFGFHAVVKVSAAVLLPALFRLIGVDWLGLAIGDGGDSIRGYARVDQKVFGGGGAAVAKAKIVLFAPALVAMTFESEFDAGVIFQKTRVAG